MKILLLSLLALTAVGARAQSIANSPPPTFDRYTWAGGNQDVGISMGAFVPMNHFGYSPGDRSQRDGNPGYSFAVDYYHAVRGNFSMGVEGSYLIRQPRTIENATPDSVIYGTSILLPSNTQVQGNSRNLMLMLRLRSTGTGWHPYAIAGLGVSQTHLEIDDVSAPGYVWYAPPTYTQSFTLVQGNSTTFACTGRVGIDYTSGSGVQLGIEAGYYHIPTSTYALTSAHTYLSSPPSPNFTNVNSGGDGISLSARASIRFGGS